MMRGLRVLALVTDAYGASGGIAQYNRDLLGALDACPSVGDIKVLSLKGGAHSDPLPGKIRQVGPAGGRIAYVAHAAVAAFTGPCDMIFCGHLHLAPVAAALAAIWRVPLVTQLHGIEIWGPLSPVRRWGLERSEAVLCVSRDTRSRALAAASLEPERVLVLPNTVDPVYTPGDQNAARTTFGFGRNRILLTVGRLDPREAYKGHDRVIAALPELLQTEPDILYMIAGDGEDRQRLERLALASGVTHAVRFLGYVPAGDLPDLYRAADVFVMPSTGEGFGIVFLEAMACGTPAVGLGVGGTPDALVDGALGHVASETTLARVIRSALDAPLRGEPLSGAVFRRFGRQSFRQELHSMLMTWFPLASSEAGIGAAP